MLSPEQENDLRVKSEKGLCHKKGCQNTGSRRVTLTFADDSRHMQTLKGWECEEHFR